MDERKKLTGWKKLIFNEYSLVAIICIITICFGRGLNIVRVSGSSMYPTYLPNQLLRTTSNTNHIKYQDVVIFNIDENKVEDNNKSNKKEKLIKRVIAVEGDIVQIKNGKVYRNNKELKEDLSPIKDEGIAKEPIKVGKNQFFVLGDNRNGSTDSRKFGTINSKDITNVVKGKLIPITTQKKGTKQ